MRQSLILISTVLAIASSTLAVDVLPGDIMTLPGTSTEEANELVGMRVWEQVDFFEIKDRDGVVLCKGRLSLHVVRTVMPAADMFELRITDTEVDLPGEIREIRWDGFSGMRTDCNWRHDLDLGDKAAMRAGRSHNGDVVTLGYNWWSHDPWGDTLSLDGGEDSSQMFILTNQVGFLTDSSTVTIELMTGETWETKAPGPKVDLLGDINGDGKVDGADLGLLIADWGTTGPHADLNGDGVVDGGDLGILLANWK